MKPISIFLVEDDQDFCYLTAQAVGGQPDMELIGTCASEEKAVMLAQRDRPDIVLMDLSLAANGDGAQAARQIRLTTDARVIILSAFDAPETVIQASVRAFASAYMSKSQFPLLLPTIREIAAGPTPQSHLICSAILQVLSPAEKVVFQRMLGHEMGLNSSPKTIANQQTSVLHKLDLGSKAELRHIFAAYFPLPPSDSHKV